MEIPVLKNTFQGNGKESTIVSIFMKKLWAVIASVIVLIACKKQDNSFVRSGFTGAWEFENYSGYPFTNNYAPPGNGRIIVLYPDGSFERKQHDSIMFKGRYFVKKQKDCYSDEEKNHFTTNDTATSYDAYINIESGKLTLTTPACYADGGRAYYRRIE
jgi:hypothetical protein